MAILDDIFGKKFDMGGAGHLDGMVEDEATEDTQLVEVHRDGKTFYQHREKGHAQELTDVPKGLRQKAVAAAKAVHQRAAELIVRLTPAAQKVGAVLGVILDTPDDMKKFAYNPTTSGGKAATNDFVSANMQDAFGVGVSGHIVASVVANVLSRAVMYAKGKIAGEEVDAPLLEYATFVSALYAAAFEDLGLDGEVPKPEDIAKALGDLIDEHEA